MNKSRVALFSVAGVLLMSSLAFGHANHWTSGTVGPGTTSSHTNNPGHLAIALRSPSTGDITSGGRYHDVCNYSTYTCEGAQSSSWASDWSLDVAGAGNSNVVLYLDIEGVGVYADPAPDPNRNMAVYAVAGPTGNFRSPADPACNWQRFDIMTTYYDAAGTKYGDRLSAQVYFAHITNTYASGTTLQTNMSHPNPKGTGTIYYLNIPVGTVYAGAGTVTNSNNSVCSGGAHVHVEAYNNHNWGNLIEWHSIDGPDGYNDHIHKDYGVMRAYGATAMPSYNTVVADTVTQGSNVLFWLGGDPTSFKMSDNPNTTDH